MGQWAILQEGLAPIVEMIKFNITLNLPNKHMDQIVSK
jgi:hypothetical protein